MPRGFLGGLRGAVRINQGNLVLIRLVELGQNLIVSVLAFQELLYFLFQQFRVLGFALLVFAVFFFYFFNVLLHAFVDDSEPVREVFAVVVVVYRVYCFELHSVNSDKLCSVKVRDRIG